MKTSWILTGLMAVAVAGCASAPADEAPAMPSFTAALAAPAGITASGTGTGQFTYDPASHALNYTVTYSGLTGPAMAAHIHGPADPGANAPPVVPFASPASPITGTATLTDEQAAQLMAGKWYVNVHTAANKGGEIRGQIMPK